MCEFIFLYNVCTFTLPEGYYILIHFVELIYMCFGAARGTANANMFVNMFIIFIRI